MEALSDTSRPPDEADVRPVLAQQRQAEAGDDWDVPVEAAYAAFERALSAAWTPAAQTGPAPGTGTSRRPDVDGLRSPGPPTPSTAAR